MRAHDLLTHSDEPFNDIGTLWIYSINYWFFILLYALPSPIIIKDLNIDNSKLFLCDNFPDDETQAIVEPLQKRIILCFKSDTYDGLELGFKEKNWFTKFTFKEDLLVVKKLIYKVFIQGRPFLDNKGLNILSWRHLTYFTFSFKRIVKAGVWCHKIYYFSDKG